MRMNEQIRRASAKAAYIQGWKQVVEVLLCLCPTSLIGSAETAQQQVLVDSFHQLVGKVMSLFTLNFGTNRWCSPDSVVENFL